MNTNRTFSINSELADRLKEQPNQSKIVNDLLTDYFMSGGSEKKDLVIKRAEIEADILKLNKSLDVVNAKIEKICEKEATFKETVKGVPESIIEDFKKFPDMDENTLVKRYMTIYKRKYTISIDELKKALKEWKRSVEVDIFRQTEKEIS